ncbi:MAG: nucleoside-diphosphate kinase [Ignavibacteria bacterium]|jgi:nucleoside-diphosphate kinase|nr:nucleoside-diphosphate kinase [Ignavibacteria bacterium]MBM4173969.1 nucleoside-diphosphate kinase [Ignavibacteria bacterium]
MKQRTLAIIKPDAVRNNVIGEIIAQITQAGFKVLACKLTRLTAAQAGKFYEVHKERPFYGELCDFMSSGAIVPIALEKDNAVEDYRALIGSTDPAEAAEGTIRKRFAGSKAENAVHGSDSPENAALEIAFFFTESEIVANNA